MMATPELIDPSPTGAAEPALADPTVPAPAHDDPTGGPSAAPPPAAPARGLAPDPGVAPDRAAAPAIGRRAAAGRRPLRVAVLGAGTVGRPVIEALLARSARLADHDGAPLELVGVAVRDLDRARAAGLPEALLTDAPAHLVADPGTDLIVELIGGDEPARTLIAAALAAGKAVVTANKHVIAHHGPDLERLARSSGAALRFEAAVGGGIPVLGPLAADLAANDIARVRGIVNGTTNVILTEMAVAGRDYAAALAEAQAAGYAEADPSGDVEGFDARNKLVILARLAFGVWLEPGSVIRRGIVGLDPADLRRAAAEGYAIRLVARAERTPDGIAAAVEPCAVPLDSPLGRTDGVLNRIEIDGRPVGRVAFEGPGAGGAATSSAVLGDCLAVARGAGSTWAGLPPAAWAEAVGSPMTGEGDLFAGRYPVLEA
jgi:homoserine dehydrogenase